MWSSRVFYCLALCHLVASQLQPVVQSGDKKIQYILQTIAFVERLEVTRNFIFFLSDCQSSTCESLPRRATDRFAMPMTIIGNELVSLEGLITWSTVLVIIFSDFTDQIKQAIEKDSYAQHFASLIFVHDSEKDLPLNETKRVELFNWCRGEGMIKVALVESYQKEQYRTWASHESTKVLKMKLLTDWQLRNIDEKLFLRIHKQLKFHMSVSVYESLPVVFVVIMK